MAGHFGEWLQGRLGADGPVVLVTLSCPDLGVTAVRVGDGPFCVEQSKEIIPRVVAERLFRALDAPLSGRFRLSADMPLGAGAGASTAALVALARGGRGRS